MQDLFIKYANADLENHPEQLMFVFERAKAFNREYSVHQDPYLQNVSYPHPEIFRSVINTCEALSPHLESSYPELYAMSEVRVCNGESSEKIIPFDREIRLIALEGSFFWAVSDGGCKACRFNDCFERDQIRSGRKINCVFS